MKTTHTPTPWPEPDHRNDVGPDDDCFWEWWEIEGVGKFDKESDALLARRAVNSHAALVEALDTIAKGMTNKFPGAPDVMEMTPDEFRHTMWTWSQKVARAALKEDVK